MLDCRPKQQAQVLAAFDRFEVSLARLKADRSALLQALASMQQHLDGVPAPAAVPEAELARAQAVETGISRVLQSADHEAIALALEDNMSRENQQWWGGAAGGGRGAGGGDGWGAEWGRCLHAWALPGMLAAELGEGQHSFAVKAAKAASCGQLAARVFQSKTTLTAAHCDRPGRAPRGIMSWSLCLVLQEHQMAQIALAAWPHMPSCTQVLAAYVREVLSHEPRL
jgi:hypothetical protein